jgi:hypothetical protein
VRGGWASWPDRWCAYAEVGAAVLCHLCAGMVWRSQPLLSVGPCASHARPGVSLCRS